MKTYPRTCKNGHLIEGPEDERGGRRCLVCQQKADRRYRDSEKGKAASETWNKTDKGLARHVRYDYSSKGMIRSVRRELRDALVRREELG